MVRATVAVGVPLLAVVLLAFMLVPAEVWKEPQNDFTYSGFDPQLIYVNESGSGSSPGQVQTTPDELTITALQSSRPTVHFFTTPLNKVNVSTDVRVLESGDGSQPLRLGIWTPREGTGFFLDFEGAPGGGIFARAIEDGVGGSSLQGGKVVSEQYLGSYGIDEAQHIEFSLDKDAGTASIHLTGDERTPSGHPMLRLEGGPASASYHDIVSDPVAVQAGVDYVFGGAVKQISGRDAYKVSVQWLDAKGASRGFAGDWRGSRFLQPATWNENEFTAQAPVGAVTARLYLGSGNGTRLLFSDLFLRPNVASQDVNLLANGNLLAGPSGWQFVGGASLGSSYSEPHIIDVHSAITQQQLPKLFSSLRLTYSAVAASSNELSSVSLTNYQLTVPHQRFYGVKIDDPRLKIPFAIALALAALLVLLQGMLYLRQRATRSRLAARPLIITLTRATAWCAAAIAVYLVGNALLFGLGSHPFDMSAEKFWTYIAVKDGPAQLYYLPNFVSLASVWNGGPWHEAVFPYGGVLAYIFTAIGALDRIFLSGPVGAQAQSFSSEASIKATVVLFGLADGILIYHIVKRATESPRWGTFAAAAFLFNPAVWFSMSVWGQTHVISIFFTLLAILFMFKRQPTSSWLSLAAAALTRPQMLVPVFLLAVVLMKLFPLRQNLRSVCWTVLGASLVMAPFTLVISPSLPVDILYNQFHFQEAGGNETAQTIVSLGAYSIWPVVSGFANGAVGVDRFHQIASDSLIGPLSYQRVSALLAGSIVLFAAAVIVFRGRKDSPADYLLPVAIGTVGFFVTKTGLAATHMIIVLPFLLLCAGRVRAPAYWAIAVAWSVTTLVPMWGGLGEALRDVKQFAPALHPDNNPLTWAFMKLYPLDEFVLLAVAANVAVFLWLCVELVWQPASQPEPAEAIPFADAMAYER